MYVSLIIDGSDARADPLGHTNFIPPFTILPVAGFSSPDRERKRERKRVRIRNANALRPLSCRADAGRQIDELSLVASCRERPPAVHAWKSEAL